MPTSLPQPVFDESIVTAVPTHFETEHPSDTAQYDAIKNIQKKNVAAFKRARGKPDALYPLESALGAHGADAVKRIKDAGQIVFHAAGDTGASNARLYKNELQVADMLAADYHTSDQTSRPSFFFQLGDIVYNFGEAKYYYDQFYEPHRNYPAPIFAIPGNHDSFVLPGTPKTETPLAVFARNFCAKKFTITPEAGSLHRTAMTQPGVYFTLDAPFVRIIGLFSNALEDPGLISSETMDGKTNWPGVPDVQLKFLAAQLDRVRREKYSGAVLLAVHHPPFSYFADPQSHKSGGVHGCSPVMLRQIDLICQAAGVYPHAFLSGHAHNYQRYTRQVTFGGKLLDVPFVVCGGGGHHINTLVQPRKGQPLIEPGFNTSVKHMEFKPALPVTDLTLEKYDDHNYGYLRVSVDKKNLRIAFHRAEGGSLQQSRFDLVTIDLATHTKVAN